MDHAFIVYVISGFMMVITFWFWEMKPRIVYKIKEVPSEADKKTISEQFDTWIALFATYKDLKTRYDNNLDALREYAAENRDLAARLRRCEGGDPDDEPPATGPDYKPPRSGKD